MTLITGTELYPFDHHEKAISLLSIRIPLTNILNVMNIFRLLANFTIGAALIIASIHPVLAEGDNSSASSYAPAPNPSKQQTVMHELILEARLTEKGQAIEKGLVWRVFSENTKKDGKYPVIGSAKGGTVSFNLPTGTYLVHAAFGRAGATKKVALARGGGHETFVLKAGGLKLNAITGAKPISSNTLLFSIYSQERDEHNKRKVIARNVPADQIIRLNTGTYHVVSNYGKINASVRADLRVQAGRLTEATLQHRAAQITLKLVSQKGGDAIANTAWSIVSGQGAVVKESSSTFPTMVLEAGDYTALARNGDTVYKRDFSVSAGIHSDVEVLATK